jgi:hypothetical protein
MAHHEQQYVRIKNCEVGVDSRSGLAFSCEIDGDHFWVPYSQCRRRDINDKTHNEDTIEVIKWWCEKNELEGEAC